jgi:apolipoprotein D and lipocalin family protein
MLRPLLFASACLLATPAFAQVHTPTSNLPVPSLDLARYAGTWHEIAHLPMFFQRKCVSDITAVYTPLKDGTLRVENSCRDKDGDLETATGTARSVTGRSGALEVRFAPRWLSWAPVAWGDYWVVEIDPDYRWAVVGGGSREHLWILSRTPTMDRELFEDLRKRTIARGYDLSELVIAAPLK